MVQIAVAVLGTDLVRPLLELGRVYLDRGAALATGEMVVVAVDYTATVEGLTTVGHHHVDVVTGDQPLELGVDRGQGNLTAVAHDEGVEFLGADESLHDTEDAEDLAALGRYARTHVLKRSGELFAFWNDSIYPNWNDSA